MWEIIYLAGMGIVSLLLLVLLFKSLKSMERARLLLDKEEHFRKSVPPKGNLKEK